MLTCGMCGIRLARRMHRDAFAGAVCVRKRMENLRFIADSLGRHPVLTARGYETINRLSLVADEGEPVFARLHESAHGLWRGLDVDWPQARRWIDTANAQLEPWMLLALMADY